MVLDLKSSQVNDYLTSVRIVGSRDTEQQQQIKRSFAMPQPYPRNDSRSRRWATRLCKDHCQISQRLSSPCHVMLPRFEVECLRNFGLCTFAVALTMSLATRHCNSPGMMTVLWRIAEPWVRDRFASGDFADGADDRNICAWNVGHIFLCRQPAVEVTAKNRDPKLYFNRLDYVPWRWQVMACPWSWYPSFADPNPGSGQTTSVFKEFKTQTCC